MKLTLFLFIALLSVSSFAKKKKDSFIKEQISRAEEAFIQAPKDNEVCFSPEERCDVKLAKFIEGAKSKLDVAIYDINNDMIVHQVLVQTKKIPVRIVVDRRQAKGSHSSVDLLIKAGANVRYGYQRSIFHNKFTIVDNARVETGSFNYTNNATKNNNENQVYLSTPEIVKRYSDRFEKIWAEATPISGSNVNRLGHSGDY